MLHFYGTDSSQVKRSTLSAQLKSAITAGRSPGFRYGHMPRFKKINRQKLEHSWNESFTNSNLICRRRLGLPTTILDETPLLPPDGNVSNELHDVTIKCQEYCFTCPVNSPLCTHYRVPLSLEASPWLPFESHPHRHARNDPLNHHWSQHERATASKASGVSKPLSSDEQQGRHGRSLMQQQRCNIPQFGLTCSLPLGRNCPWRTPSSVPVFFSLAADAWDPARSARQVCMLPTRPFSTLQNNLQALSL